MTTEKEETEIEITEQEQDPDWLSELHQQRDAIAEAIAVDKLVPLQAALDSLAVRAPDPKIDPFAASLQMRNDLRHAARHALEGYCVWLMSEMVRSNRFEPFRVGIPSEEVMQAIADYYEVAVPIIRLVIACANEEKRLPIVGDICGGTLVPDVASIKRWANHFDWSE